LAPRTDAPRAGLRERKKAKTREAIQTHALRLFRRQGYAATTVEQIIDAAEVSETTFYRYFPNKRDLLLSDDLDPLFAEAFMAQPPERTALEAIQAALRSVLAALSPRQQAEQRDRLVMIMEVPELRAGMLDQFADAIHLITRIVAERTGRGADDPAVRTLAGAVIGVGVSAMLAIAADPTRDLSALLDESFDHLGEGLTI
jgi:AcrR family transcriptional regulator